MDDDDVFELIFGDDSEGAVPIMWERAERCDCWTEDTRQPTWGHEPCGGFGTRYGTPIEVRGLFRSQGKWNSHRSSGQHSLGEASITLPADVKPTFTDERVRDRFTLAAAVDKYSAGRVFYPAAEPVEFIFDGVLRGWRVQLQSLDQATRLKPQP